MSIFFLEIFALRITWKRPNKPSMVEANETELGIVPVITRLNFVVG